MHTEILSPMAVSVSLSVGVVVNGHKSFMAATGLYGACLPPIQTSQSQFFGTVLAATACGRSNFMKNQKAYQQGKGEGSI